MKGIVIKPLLELRSNEFKEMSLIGGRGSLDVFIRLNPWMLPLCNETDAVFIPSWLW